MSDMLCMYNFQITPIRTYDLWQKEEEGEKKKKEEVKFRNRKAKNRVISKIKLMFEVELFFIFF